jgi:hypothetical protein
VSILNRPSDGLLTVLLALRRALVAYGPQPEARLLELCAPPSIVAKPDMARRTMTRWTQLGFFEEVEGQFQLHKQIANVGTDDLDGLRMAVLRLVLAPTNNPLLASDPDSDIERSLASDCTRAIAWAMAQDPYSFQGIVGHPAAEALETHQGVEPRLFRNDTRWFGFKDWAPFLGMAFPSSRGSIVLNPAYAVRAVLNEVFANTRELALELFMARLAEQLPVLDGGSYRLIVDAQVSRPWRIHRDNEISPSLSAALLTLEASGNIRLEPRSDAPQRILLGRGGNQVRSISHVVRLGVTDASS